jgi:hypothetical protein
VAGVADWMVLPCWRLTAVLSEATCRRTLDTWGLTPDACHIPFEVGAGGYTHVFASYRVHVVRFNPL